MRNEHLVDPHEARPTAATAHGPYGELLQVARDATGPESFLRKALDKIATAFASPYAVVYARLDATVVQDAAHRGDSDPAFWKAAVEQFLTESLAEGRTRARLLSARNADLLIALIAAPLFGPQGDTLGAVALVTRVTESDARRAAGLLESMAAFTSAICGQLAGNNTRGQIDSSKTASALARAASFNSLTELAFSLTNNLRNKLGAAQIALGLAKKRRVKLLSISGLDEVRPRSPGIAPLAAAMEECLDHAAPIVAQRDGGFTDDGATARYRLHRAWHDAAGGSAVASIPLLLDERVLAIVSIRRDGHEAFTTEDIDRITQMVTPFAPALALVREAKRGVWEHTKESINNIAHATIAPRAWGRKALAAAVLAFSAWFCFGTLPYELVVPATLNPSTVRHIAAPSQAVLAETHALPGDPVRAGQLICRFDDREAALEETRLVAELAVAQREVQAARGADDPVAAQLASANAALLQTQLDIARTHRARMEIHAPIDGVVIEGDPRHSLGAVIEQGAPLYKIAPLDAWKLELAAPQYAAPDLEPGLAGRFVPNAHPERASAITLARIRPQTEQRDARTVLALEANLNDDQLQLQPGMEGMAKLELGRRPVWWIVLHRARDYLKLNFWL